MPEGDADRIRGYLCHLVEHARSKGEPRFSVAAGEICGALGLNDSNAILDICEVLKTQKSSAVAGAELLCQTGTGQRVDSVFLFKVNQTGQAVRDRNLLASKNAAYGMYFLENSVLSVLRDAAPKYLGPADISGRTKIFGKNLKIEGKEKVTSHSIIAGILAKLYCDDRVDYKYRGRWRLKSAETGD